MMSTNKRPPQPVNRNQFQPRQPDIKPRGKIYVALDLETTGVEADVGDIIEVAAIKFRLEAGGQMSVLDRWQTFVRPSQPIPYKITNLTGIKQSDVANAPNFEQIRERLRNFLGDHPIVGHSIESDIGF